MAKVVEILELSDGRLIAVLDNKKMYLRMSGQILLPCRKKRGGSFAVTGEPIITPILMRTMEELKMAVEDIAK